jgi:GAF domain-containing protein
MADRSFISKAINPEESIRAMYKNWRQKFVLPLLIGVLVFGSFVLVSAVSSAQDSVLSIVFIAAYVITLVVTLIKFSYEVRITIFLMIVYVIAVSELVRYNILGDASIFFLGVVVFATMLLSPRAGIIALAMSIIGSTVIGILMINGVLLPISPDVVNAKVEDWISGIMVILMFGIVIILGFQWLEREFLEAQTRVDNTVKELEVEREKLEEKVLERTIKLRRVNEIGRTIAAVLEPSELLARAMHLIGDEFECYFAAVYILDVTEQWAELKEATGDAGKVLRENKHRLDMKGKNLVSQSIRTRQVRIALDTGNDPVRFDNPLLPYTRSQIIIPLAVGERIIGAIELHSTKASAFLPQEMDTYQNMANEVAIAFENARLFNEAQQSLNEMRATQRQYLQGAWSSLAAEQRLEYSLGEKEASGNDISVPLLLRDQILGQIEMTGHDKWTIEQKNLIEAVATQAALALENARLVEESQSIAARERLANEIISKVWSSTTMDSILQTTVRELGRSLEASEISIELIVDEGLEGTER